MLNKYPKKKESNLKIKPRFRMMKNKQIYGYTPNIGDHSGCKDYEFYVKISTDS